MSTDAGRSGGRLLLLSIGLLSGAGLAFEVLLMRLLSIVQWHHFAYMVISLALLGFAASGTFLSLTRRRLAGRFAVAYLLNAALFGVTLLAGFALAQRLPFNPLELVWEPRQTLWLGALYLLLAVPFFCLANAVGLALYRFSDRIDRIYRADLVGAGAGAAGVVALLFLLHPAVCLRVLAGVGMAGAAVAAWDPLLGRRRAAGVVLLAAGLLLPAAAPSGWTALRISQFKEQSQVLRRPGAEVIARESGPLGLLAVVHSPCVPLRHAPGLSLAFPGRLPDQLGVFTDGGSLTVINRFDPAGEPPAYLDYLTSAAPYHLLDAPSVVVLGAGGGTEVLSALAHGAQEIDAVEVDRRMAGLVGRRFADFAGHLYEGRSVRLHVAEARSFLARRETRWDLVQVSLVDSFAAVSAGVHASSESTLYTVEALEAMLARLRPCGLLALTRWALAAAVLAALYLPLLPRIVQHGLGLPDAVRFLMAVALLPRL